MWKKIQSHQSERYMCVFVFKLHALLATKNTLTSQI